MNIHEITSLVASGLQFVVAAYALRLNRTFGTAKVGWSLFSAFSLLALLHLFPAITVQASFLGAYKIELVYLLASLLLLIGMMHIESIFKERQRREAAELRLRTELESEVKKKTAYLTRAIEQLQSEIDSHHRTEAELKAHIDLLQLYNRQGVSGAAASERVAANV